MVEGAGRTPIRLEGLLGRPLNDVEARLAPKEIFCEGGMEVPLPRPRVSVVGSRKASEEGLSEAGEIAGALVEGGAVVVSGLARGIDTAGHRAALERGGRTIAVIGTPLDRVYPKENLELQNELKRDHMVVSQYAVGHPTTPKDFVLRNRTMALISDAAVIVEAGDASGSLHHGREALRMGRPLFICRAAVENERLRWPKQMIRCGAVELGSPKEVLGRLPAGAKTVSGPPR